MNDLIVGGSVPADVLQEVADLISVLGEKYYFQQGDTAAFWAVVYTLAGQLGEGRE